MNQKSPIREPSSDEYARIAQGFDVAAGDLINSVARWLRRIKWSIVFVLALLLVAFIAEDLWWRWRVHGGAQVLDSVMVTRYYAIHKKNGKVEYDSDVPYPEACLNSAFPHLGANPCWYVRRNTHPILDR